MHCIWLLCLQENLEVKMRLTEPFWDFSDEVTPGFPTEMRSRKEGLESRENGRDLEYIH